MNPQEFCIQQLGLKGPDRRKDRERFDVDWFEATPATRDALLSVCRHFGKHGACWAKHRTLAAVFSHARETICRLLPYWVAKGWLKVFGREDGVNPHLPRSTTHPGGIRSNVVLPAIDGQITQRLSKLFFDALEQIREAVKLRKRTKQLGLPLEQTEASGSFKTFAMPQVVRPPGAASAAGEEQGHTPQPARPDPINRSAPPEQGAAQDGRAPPEPPPAAPTGAETASPSRSPRESMTDRRIREQEERLAQMAALARKSKEQP